MPPRARERRGQNPYDDAADDDPAPQQFAPTAKAERAARRRENIERARQAAEARRQLEAAERDMRQARDAPAGEQRRQLDTAKLITQADVAAT